MKIKRTVNIIGGGFAGIECALFLASHGINVHIFVKDEDYYKCDCQICENLGRDKKNKNNARDLLREELKILGSSLIEQECKLTKNGLIECGCVASRLLEYGRELLKNNPKIQVFNLSVKELDIDEVNIVATGPHTDKDLFEWLKNQFGSMRLIDEGYENPIVDNVDTSLLFKKEGDNSDDLFYPLDYQEYIDLCNEIVKAHNDYLDLSGNKKIDSSEFTIEKLIGKGKDALKNYALRECKLVGYNQRPYAVLRLKKHNLGYELCGLCSQLPFIFQDKIIFTLKPFKQAKLVRISSVKQSRFLNSPYIINYNSQAVTNEKLFFAGGVIGLDGHLEAMESGIYVAMNVLGLLFGKKLASLPENTMFGSIMKKIILVSALKFSPVFANYDIIGYKEDCFYSREDIKSTAKQQLLKYKENFDGKQFNA